MIALQLTCIALLLTVCQCTAELKILAFLPFPARSHHIAFVPMLKELAIRGHQIDYYTPVVPTNPPPNLRIFKIANAFEKMEKKPDMKSLMHQSVPTQSIIIAEMAKMMGEQFLKDDLVKKLLSSKEKYDLIILETQFGQEYLTVLTHKFNALGVSLMPLPDVIWVNELTGLVHNPSYMLDYKTKSTDDMSFLERLHNTYILASTLLISYYYVIFPMQSLADELIRYDGWESRPSILKLSSDMALTLMNSHHSFGYPSPNAPNVKEVGGMNISPLKPLPQDLQQFMDSASNGVIYFSYGSNVDMKQMMADDKFDAFLHTFKKLPQKVLWKWSGDQKPDVDASNIKFGDWFPQQDLLAHKNMKLFITHGGMMSTVEAINYGVPVIGTAIFGDQPKNLKFIEHAGIGINLEYENITRTSVAWAVNTILSDPSYKTNMMKRSQIFKDRPMTPVEEAAYWVEYVGKYGKVLQSAAVHMPFYQVYMLDIFATIGGSLLLIACVCRRIVRGICSMCLSRPKPVASTKKRQ